MSIEVCAHITGTVWQIRVEVGAQVTEGQSLVVLESMKMEMPVEAPEDGKVVELCVSEGQAVEEGDVVARLDPAGG
jgi:acetyl-CoA carboxylase biotin carboxyl carrier protein